MSSPAEYNNVITPQDAVIASGATDSSALTLYQTSLAGFVVPASFTGTTVTFKGSVDGSTYVPVYDRAGTLVSVSVGTSRYVAVDPTVFYGLRFVKLVSGSAEGAERTLKCSIALL